MPLTATGYEHWTQRTYLRKITSNTAPSVACDTLNILKWVCKTLLAAHLRHSIQDSNVKNYKRLMCWVASVSGWAVLTEGSQSQFRLRQRRSKNASDRSDFWRDCPIQLTWEQTGKKPEGQALAAYRPRLLEPRAAGIQRKGKAIAMFETRQRHCHFIFWCRRKAHSAQKLWVSTWNLSLNW